MSDTAPPTPQATVMCNGSDCNNAYTITPNDESVQCPECGSNPAVQELIDSIAPEVKNQFEELLDRHSQYLQSIRPVVVVDDVDTEQNEPIEIEDDEEELNAAKDHHEEADYDETSSSSSSDGANDPTATKKGTGGRGGEQSHSRSRSRSRQREFIRITLDEEEGSSRSRSRHSRGYQYPQQTGDGTAGARNDDMDVDDEKKANHLDDEKVEQIVQEWTDACKHDGENRCWLKAPIQDYLRSKIKHSGLKGPTPYQILLLHSFEIGVNCIGHDMPRSGKSLALVLALAQKLKLLPREQDTVAGRISSELLDLQAVYISPDRDGCRDTKKLIEEMVRFFKLSVMSCYGGFGNVEFRRSLELLDDPKGVNVICCCPGRLAHLISVKGREFLQNVTTVILDQYDIIKNNYKKDRDSRKEIQIILDAMPDKALYSYEWETTTSWITESAAFPIDVNDPKYNMDKRNKKPISNLNNNARTQRNGNHIRANEHLLFADYIQHYVIGNRGWVEKNKQLSSLLATLKNTKSLVFVNSNAMVEELNTKLHKLNTKFNLQLPPIRKYGAKVLTQKERESVQKQIRSDDPCIVICTDLAAMNHHGFKTVIQYELCQQKDGRDSMEEFLRRMGRLTKAHNEHCDETRNHYVFFDTHIQGRGRQTEDEILLNELRSQFKVEFKTLRQLPPL